jgi:hypothetical protein
MAAIVPFSHCFSAQELRASDENILKIGEFQTRCMSDVLLNRVKKPGDLESVSRSRKVRFAVNVSI